MRRFWAYIITVFTALVLVGTTFTSVFVNAKSNIEYENGKEIVFRISDEEDLNPEDFQSGVAAKEIASIMEDRLALQGISKYRIAIEGNDTIKVEFSADDNETQKVIKFLSFNGSLALTTTNDDVVLGEEFLTDKKAYLVDQNGLPTIVLPVNNENATFKSVIQALKDQQEELNDRVEVGSEEEEQIAYLYLWCDYIEDVDSFDKTQETLNGETNPEYDPNVANKILMPFSAKNLYFNEEEDKLASAINLDANGDESVSVNEVSKAYSDARYYVNLINAGKLDYKVEYMYEKDAAPIYESLLSLNMHVTLNWGATLVATLLAILVISALLATFYCLGSLSGITTSILSTFAGVCFIVLFGVEFNTAAIIGLILVAVASIISSVVYCNKLKEEAYKGRSLKKANTEAAKKSVLPIVDINVVVIVIGAAMYLLGGVLFKAFAAATVLGGVVSLLLNLTLLRGMMWLVTNTTDFTGKYSLFGIEEDKVPNIAAEEKQTYFGAYSEKDLTAKKKPIGIVAALVAVASIAGGVVFGTINNGNVYNDGGISVANTQIYFETSAKNTAISESYLDSIASDIKVHSEDTTASRETAKTLKSYIEEIESYTNTVVEDKIEVTYTYFVVTLNTNLSSESYAYYKDGVSENINDTLATVITKDDSKAEVDVKEVKYVEQDQPSIAPIALATGVATLVLGLYFILRYRLSRGISTTLISLLTGITTIGIFVLTRMVVPTYISVALPVVVAFAFILGTILNNREREMVIEDKTRDDSPAHRYEVMVKANSIAFTPIIVATVLAIYLGINFFGFGLQATSALFLTIIVGMLLAALFVSTLQGPTSALFYKWFYRDPATIKPRKSKNSKKVARKKTAEPEEATFIGIND